MNPQLMLSNMASSSFEALASTLLTNIVMKKWNLDYSYFGLVFACVYGGVEFLRAEIMTVNLKEWIYSMSYLHWGSLIIVYLAYVYHDHMFRMIFKFFPKKLLKFDDDHLTIRIYDIDKIRILLKYMEYFPEHFDSNYDIDVGDQQIQAQLFMDPFLPNNGQKLHEYMGL